MRLLHRRHSHRLTKSGGVQSPTQPEIKMNPNNLSNYIGETWYVDNKPGEAIGATVCGYILIQFRDGSTKLCKP